MANLYSRLLLGLCCTAAFLPPVWAAEASPATGLELLLNKPYVPYAFDQETFDQVWQSWEEPLRSEAAAATPDERRALAYKRYGLIERENDPLHRPLQYVVDQEGRWTINCLACHQGSVAGKMIPGAPNAQYALETLTEDIRNTKIRIRKEFTDLDVGSMVMPLGKSVGTTNAIMFGVALMHYRDEHLNLILNKSPPLLTHHDHDAPPWWNVAVKQRLYADNFAPRGHRALMQFIASKENGPEKFRAWEEDFRHVEAYIDTLKSPKYPYKIDAELAEQGRAVFGNACADCHGTYGDQPDYPERIIPWEVIGTDPVRLRALTKKHREGYGRNWINEYGQAGQVIADPQGYLAPPLHGVWASAPYFHNGSVPTLWHVLHPEDRPTVWVRTDIENYDRNRVGLDIESVVAVPAGLPHAQIRQYFDTTSFGKSAEGHTFPEELSESQRQAVLEYLKTL